MLVTLLACASPGMPPGGPPDNEAPFITRILPDSNATNVRASVVRLYFDEVISERPGAPRVGAGGVATGAPGASGGATRGGFAQSAPSAGPASGAGLASVVLISPSDGRERVEWRRTALEIKPRGGFRPNTTYRVTVLPGIADLRGNVIATPLEFVFSTGDAIRDGRITGVVFDWAAARPAANARVEVFPAGDSSYRWSARADSLGRFVVRDLAVGSYALRAWVDADNDRLLGPRELFDTATVTTSGTATVELYAFVHDTLPARLESVDVADSLALRLRFDRAILADWDPTGAVEIVGADSVPRPLVGLVPRTVLDSLRRAAAAAARAAADTAGADSARADTTAASTDPSTTRPVFGRAAPVQNWAAPLDSPLAPGLYRIRVRGARGLNGVSGASEREFRIRAPVAPPPATAPPSTAPPPTRPDSGSGPR